mmetsp:Transcript_9758/g.29074  ORF Transcript_9758/g.29074 Transcript_9758/m.29074 type:complete len:200 (-) Transcript_9758:1935-2534(-)
MRPRQVHERQDPKRWDHRRRRRRLQFCGLVECASGLRIHPAATNGEIVDIYHGRYPKTHRRASEAAQEKTLALGNHSTKGDGGRKRQRRQQPGRNSDARADPKRSERIIRVRNRRQRNPNSRCNNHSIGGRDRIQTEEEGRKTAMHRQYFWIGRWWDTGQTRVFREKVFGLGSSLHEDPEGKTVRPGALRTNRHHGTGR